MNEQDSVEKVANQQQEADAEFVDWLRAQYERMSSGRLCSPVSDDPLDKTYFFVSDADFEWFRDVLDNPPPPSEGLRKFMARKAPWE